MQYSSIESDSDSDHEEALEKMASSDMQGQILKELKRMSSRLNAVEQQVGTSSHDSNHDSRRSKRSKISSVVRHSKCNARAENTDSSLSENSNSDDDCRI